VLFCPIAPETESSGGRPPAGAKIDELVKSGLIPFSVIPAEAGIQSFQAVLDPGVRRGDDKKDFLRLHQDLFSH
jgi:hypothetical protein